MCQSHSLHYVTVLMMNDELFLFGSLLFFCGGSLSVCLLLSSVLSEFRKNIYKRKEEGKEPKGAFPTKK